MPKKVWILFFVLVLLASLVVACGSSSEPTSAPEPAVSVDAALKLTGPAQGIAWTEDDLAAMQTVDVDYTDKDGVTTTYTGVLITALLEAGGVTGTPDLTLVAGDGYSYDLAAADYEGCGDCIVAFDPEGGLRSVLPALGGKAQVKGLAEIQVK